MFNRKPLFRLTPTTILVTANILVYIYTSVMGGNFLQTGYDELVTFGQINRMVLSGQYWQMLTSMFVHVDIVHIALNMLFLVIFGFRAEELFKPEEYFSIYILSGLAGNIFTLFLVPEYIISAGASGAIFGIYGANIIYMRKTFGQSIIGALLYAFMLLALTTGEQVNVVAHFGGLVAGLAIGYILAKMRKDMFWIEEY
ncbi:MAG: rhomboid family intramembrane serine protease [Candidatus Bathyarchaeota archaeon]|nr:rhomboid family intramembrane serine protease [Candidatus Bathyarchaeota archaeon]